MGERAREIESAIEGERQRPDTTVRLERSRRTALSTVDKKITKDLETRRIIYKQTKVQNYNFSTILKLKPV